MSWSEPKISLKSEPDEPRADQSQSPSGHESSENSVLQETRLINEISLILAEKRTALSVMRTGLAILVLPLSVSSVLIGISRYYDPMKVIYLLGPVMAINIALTVFGLYLILRSWKRSRSLEKINLGLKIQNPNLKHLCRLIDGDDD